MAPFLMAVLLIGQQEAKPMPTIHATALALAGGRLYAGTNQGDVHVYDARTREPITLLSSGAKGVVSSVAASSNGVAWVIGSRPTTIRDRFAAADNLNDQTLFVRAPDERQFIIGLKPAGVTESVRAIAWLGPRVWILKDFGSEFYNAHSNAIELGSTFLPKGLAEEFSRSRLWIQDPYVLSARPVSMRRNSRASGLPYVSQFSLFKLDGNRWTNLGGFASNSFDVEPLRELTVGEDGKIGPEAQFSIVSETVGFDETGVAAIEGTNLLNIPLFAKNWESTRAPLLGPFAETIHADPLWTFVQGDSLWTWNGTTLVRESRTKNEGAAYLLWNDPQMIPNAFLPDESGVWVASNVGVRRIDNTDVDPILGHGGFISLKLGAEEEKTTDPRVEKLVKEIYRWRFAPADLAGKDGSRMISEVYRSIGITLPPSMPGILNSSAAVSVRSDLKIGDVISSAKGMAIYLGNGKTVELKGGVVKNGVVWERPFAVVRRFIR
jgi:hypothetical protein